MSSILNPVRVSYLFALSICFLTWTKTLGQEEGNRQKEFNLDEDNVALQGYDVVSYFMGAPQEGKKLVAYDYFGVNYWFNNTENLELFKKQPEKFEPAYGGWCAYAMGNKGEKIKVDPGTYKIIDGKLYMFYNFYLNNTLINWNKDEHQLRIRADDNWLKFFNKP